MDDHVEICIKGSECGNRQLKTIKQVRFIFSIQLKRQRDVLTLGRRETPLIAGSYQI